MIKINSLRQVWESELCTDDFGQLRSAPLLLRYLAHAHTYLACRLVPNIEAAQADLANSSLPAIDIRDVLDVTASDMSGINLRNLLPNRAQEGISKNVPSSSQPAQRKRSRVESSVGPSRLAPITPPSPLALEAPGADHQFTHLGNVVHSGMLLRSSIQTQGDGSVPQWAPYMEYRGGSVVMEADCILPVDNGHNAAVASTLSQAVRLPLDMGE